MFPAAAAVLSAVCLAGGQRPTDPCEESGGEVVCVGCVNGTGGGAELAATVARTTTQTAGAVWSLTYYMCELIKIISPILSPQKSPNDIFLLGPDFISSAAQTIPLPTDQHGRNVFSESWIHIFVPTHTISTMFQIIKNRKKSNKLHFSKTKFSPAMHSDGVFYQGHEIRSLSGWSG